MATFIHHRTPAGFSTTATPRSTARAVFSRSSARTADVDTSASADLDRSQEPSRAASVVPVLLAFGAMFALAVGAAYFGREAITFVGGLLGGV